MLCNCNRSAICGTSTSIIIDNKFLGSCRYLSITRNIQCARTNFNTRSASNLTACYSEHSILRMVNTRRISTCNLTTINIDYSISLI